LGILQLDRGEPLGYSHIPGLIQAWLQDAGGFAMVGLAVYLGYALLTPTDKSESERIRVPVTLWMVTCAALALVLYAAYAGLLAIAGSGQAELLGFPVAPPQPPPPDPGAPIVVPPPAFHTDWQSVVLMLAGLLAILGIGQPFARDVRKIFGRNLSLGFSGFRRFGRSVSAYVGEIFSARRLALLGVFLAAYGALGVAVYAFGTDRLFGIYLGVCIVALTVFVLGLLVLMLFQAEGPVWAIAKLSFKEAVRSQLLWVFLLIFLPFLFPVQWFRTIKPADELRTTVEWIGTVLTFLVLFPALLLASFGLPNDIKNLNIFTVVSKPVERFEIALGRFVGYASLMTLVLIGLTGVSLVLIMNTSISERAREETYKARVPVRGSLIFRSLRPEHRTSKEEFAGENVGREFDYRRYIVGHPTSPHRAIWQFATVPEALGSAGDDRVPVEFTFDIFKLTKGVQNKGAGVSFRFVTHNAPQRAPNPANEPTGEWHWVDSKREAEYKQRTAELANRGLRTDGAAPGTPAWVEANRLAEEFGIFEYSNKEVLDYAILGVEVPAGLFRNALQGEPGKDEKGNPLPRVSVYVKCETPGQLLGMAQPDLYFLEYEQPFALNYLKGMVGLWCWLCIVVGIAVTCSTYLSGVLSLLAASIIFVIGFFPDLLRDVSANRSVGGGPFESMSRLVKAEQPTAPSADTAGAKALMAADRGWAWVVRRIQNVIPNLESSDWGDFVAEGYNIKTEYLLVNLLVTFGYLLPWAVLARYIMRMREVAA
jgi:hypothetical protein